MGRGNLAGHLAIPGPQDLRHVSGPPFPQSDLDHRAYQRTHHLLTERRRLDVEPQQAVAQVRPVGEANPTDERGALGPTTERSEVMFTIERIARQSHGAQVQGMGDVPGRFGEERVWDGPVEDAVAVAPPGRRPTGIKAL